MPAWWSKRKTGKCKLNKADAAEMEEKSKTRSFDGSLIGFNNKYYNPNPNSPKRGGGEETFFPFPGSPNASALASSLDSRCPAALVGFSSLDSDQMKRGHPLPKPRQTVSLPAATKLGSDIVGSGSLSVSSEGSSGSTSDDHIQRGVDFGFNCRGHADTKFSSRVRSPGGQELRSPTSPLHSGACGRNPESPSVDGRTNLCHPLPLPPLSSINTRIYGGVNENMQSNLTMRWKKGRLLGRGTFGHVYQGFNSEGGQMCAIKEVRVISDDQNSKECLRQLNQEIALLGQLSHPNIVQYYGSELVEESLSVYLEYVSGGSINKLVQEYGAFSEPVIQNYTRQILSGLAYLHGRDTIHRDIKGANILVGPNGEVKLADFGMAKHINSHCSVLSFKGSPYWMAPEVIMNIPGCSLAVDIWSLGCTIIEMAMSKPPWSQYEGVAAIFKIGNSKDVPEIPKHFSNDAKNFVKLCLQRDPFARPTATQLLDHPFIRDQAQTQVPRMNRANDIFSSLLDERQNMDRDSWMRMSPIDTSPRTMTSPRDNSRTNLSLPVSPCSSPLRQRGPANNSSFFLSPPRLSYTAGQTSYGFNNQSIFPMPHYSNCSEEFEIAQLRAGGSPRKSPF